MFILFLSFVQYRNGIFQHLSRGVQVAICCFDFGVSGQSGNYFHRNVSRFQTGNVGMSTAVGRELADTGDLAEGSVIAAAEAANTV